MSSVKGVSLLSKVYILSFTNKGYALSEKVLCELKNYDVEIIRVKNLKETVSEIFKQGNVLIFIGAVGIAVRGIAKHLEHKTKDPAVIVIDEKGEFVIPILSGHIGGANEFAMLIADKLKATPIITTSTDVNNVFSVDVFAKKNRYHIHNPENIKCISSALLEGNKVGICSEYKIQGEMPKNINIEDYKDYKNYEKGICVTLKNDTPYINTLVLKPKIYHIGMGCKKDMAFENIESLFLSKVKNMGIDINLISSISSIDLKKNEKALIELSKKYNIPFITYKKEELEIYEDLFEKSAFVKSIVGVSSVCETSAYLSSKEGEIILNKTSNNGVTIAIAKENWVVKF